MSLEVAEATSSGGSFLSGISGPDVSDLLAMYSIESVGRGIARQNETLRHADVARSIKQRIARKYNKEITRLNRRMTGLDKQLLKTKDGKEREAILRDKAAIQARLKELQETIKLEQDLNPDVRRLKEINHGLNVLNKTAAYSFLPHLNPTGSNFLTSYEGQTEAASTDRDVSGSVFIPQAGFLGFQFGAQ